MTARATPRRILPPFCRALFLGAGLALAGCGGSFSTQYPAPIPAEVTRGWHVTDVQVTVPHSLTVSEEKTYLPKADIVWREDPVGDRYAQVGRIVSDAAKLGVAPLKGPRPVVLQITMTKFHAMTFEAETITWTSGVHNIEFVARVIDAQSGSVLAGPTFIEASFPAMTGVDMEMARAQGDSQKKQITRHLRDVFAGWTGSGADPRRAFERIGG